MTFASKVIGKSQKLANLGRVEIWSSSVLCGTVGTCTCVWYMFVYVSGYVWVCKYPHMFTYMYLHKCTYLYEYACRYLCVYVYICMYLCRDQVRPGRSWI